MICFLQLRDIALKRFQLAELDDLPSVVFISAFLATAGKTVTELSFHSKVTCFLNKRSAFNAFSACGNCLSWIVSWLGNLSI